jgi:small subunit ribosomal protein S16
MAVKIRLRRMGSNKQPFFRIVATDVRESNQGRILENLGWYDPKKKKDDSSLNVERIQYWISKGALVSDTAKTLLKKELRKKGGAAASASVS